MAGRLPLTSPVRMAVSHWRWAFEGRVWVCALLVLVVGWRGEWFSWAGYLGGRIFLVYQWLWRLLGFVKTRWGAAPALPRAYPHCLGGGLWQGAVNIYELNERQKNQRYPSDIVACVAPWIRVDITQVYLLQYPIEVLCGLSSSVTDIKGYFMLLDICSLGNESDLDLEKKYKEDDREKAPKRPRTQRTEKVQKISGKEAGLIPGVKKPIISVVLTAHEAIPGDHSRREVIEREAFGQAGPRAAWQVGPCDPEQLALHLVTIRLGQWQACAARAVVGDVRGEVVQAVPATSATTSATHAILTVQQPLRVCTRRRFLSLLPSAHPSPGCAPPLTALCRGWPKCRTRPTYTRLRQVASQSAYRLLCSSTKLLLCIFSGFIKYFIILEISVFSFLSHKIGSRYLKKGLFQEGIL